MLFIGIGGGGWWSGCNFFIFSICYFEKENNLVIFDRYVNLYNFFFIFI